MKKSSVIDSFDFTSFFGVLKLKNFRAYCVHLHHGTYFIILCVSATLAGIWGSFMLVVKIQEFGYFLYFHLKLERIALF